MRKCLVAGLLSIGFGVLGLAVVLDGYYCRTSPRTPQPSQGRIYHEIVCHGANVYLTRTEYYALGFALPVMLTFAGAGIYLLNRWGKSR
jgi:hypothetical protein